jgi:hypothetical protein
MSAGCVAANARTNLDGEACNDFITLLDSSTPPVSPISVTICPTSVTMPQSNVTLTNVALSPSNVTFSPSSVSLSPKTATSFTPNATVKVQPAIVASPNIIKIVTLPQNAVTVQASHLTTSNVNVKVPIPKISKPGMIHFFIACARHFKSWKGHVPANRGVSF